MYSPNVLSTEYIWCVLCWEVCPLSLYTTEYIWCVLCWEVCPLSECPLQNNLRKSSTKKKWVGVSAIWRFHCTYTHNHIQVCVCICAYIRLLMEDTQVRGYFSSVSCHATLFQTRGARAWWCQLIWHSRTHLINISMCMGSSDYICCSIIMVLYLATYSWHSI